MTKWLSNESVYQHIRDFISQDTSSGIWSRMKDRMTRAAISGKRLVDSAVHRVMGMLRTLPSAWVWGLVNFVPR